MKPGKDAIELTLHATDQLPKRGSREWSITPEQRKMLENLAQLVAQPVGAVCEHGELKGRVGFCLMLYTWEPGFMTYVSNGNREDLVKMLREVARALEDGMVEKPLREAEEKK